MHAIQISGLALILWSAFTFSVASKERPIDLADEFAKVLVRAENGDVNAQNRVGVFYETGIGTKPDFREAKKWYSRAADRGDAAAITNLASLHISGRGVSVDFERGVELLRNAAKQGFPAAIGKLGFAYVTGQGVPFDTHEGLRLLRDAASSGDGFSAYHLGQAYYWGTYGESKNSVEAFFWIRRSAELGFPSAQLVFATFYRSGELGVVPDIEQYFRWLYLAANGGSTQAQFLLGQAFEYGEAGKINLKEAESWYRIAADNGHPLANQALYKMGLTGSDGLPPLRPANSELSRITQMLPEEVTLEGVVVKIFALGLAVELLSPDPGPSPGSGPFFYAPPAPDCWWPMKSNGFVCVPDYNEWLD